MSGKDEEDVLNKIDEKFNIIEYEEFTPDIDMDNNNPLYLIVISRDDSYFAAKAEDMKSVNKMKQLYGVTYKVEAYKVTGYNERFIMAKTTKSKFYNILQAYRYNVFKSVMKTDYGIDIEKCEKA